MASMVEMLTQFCVVTHTHTHVPAQIMVASTGACLFASRFGLAPSVRKVAQPLKLADREVIQTTGDPAVWVMLGAKEEVMQAFKPHAGDLQSYTS
eukprot:1152751-Pelagomonas_calceolata.AAC.2